MPREMELQGLERGRKRRKGKERKRVSAVKIGKEWGGAERDAEMKREREERVRDNALLRVQVSQTRLHWFFSIVDFHSRFSRDVIAGRMLVVVRALHARLLDTLLRFRVFVDPWLRETADPSGRA